MISGNNSVALVLAFCVWCQTFTANAAAQDKGFAIIEQSYSDGVLVQARTVGGKMKATMFGKPVKAEAGLKFVGIYVEFQVKPENYFTGPTVKYGDIIDFPLKLMAGHTYKAMGRQSGSFVEVWIVDNQTQELVSDIVEIQAYKCKPWRKCPQPKITKRSAL